MRKYKTQIKETKKNLKKQKKSIFNKNQVIKPYDIEKQSLRIDWYSETMTMQKSGEAGNWLHTYQANIVSLSQREDGG